MPWSTFGARLKGVFILLALGSAVSIRMAQGQEGAFLREFNFSELDQAKSVAVDGTGVYVVGDGGGGIFLRKYGSSGNELWSRTFGAGGYFAPGIAVSQGSVHVLGYIGLQPDSSFILKYDADGKEIWTRQIRSDATGVAADATGVYVAGGENDGGVLRSGFVHKYGLSGNQLWNRSLSVGWPSALAADATGAYLVGGIFSPGSGSFLQKRSGSGEELWTREFPADGLTGVAAASTGVYVAGYGDARWFVRKYDPNGNEVWSREFDFVDSSYPTGVSGVAADASGVYLAGTTRAPLPDSCSSGFQDAFVRKYDADGAPLWTRQLSGSGDYGFASNVAVDADAVYVAGDTSSCGPDHCFQKALLAKLEKTQPVRSESAPWITPGCVVNAANYLGGRVSPGEIVTISGRGIGPPEPAPLSMTEERRLTTTLAGTRVLFNGIAAPLLYVSASQINAIVPYAVAETSTADVEVEYQGVRSNVVTMPVTPSRPGLFTLDGSGRGHVAALNQDGSMNSASNPAERGSVLVLYATGEGLTTPLAEDGSVLGSAPPKPTLPVEVTICCYLASEWLAPVIYAGGASDSVAGLFQVNAQIPPDLYLNYSYLNYVSDEGEAYVELRINGQASGFGTYVFIRDVPDVPGPNDACGGCWNY